MTKLITIIWAVSALLTMIAVGILAIRDALTIFDESIWENISLFLLGVFCILSSVIIFLIISGLL